MKKNKRTGRRIGLAARPSGNIFGALKDTPNRLGGCHHIADDYTFMNPDLIENVAGAASEYLRGL